MIMVRVQHLLLQHQSTAKKVLANQINSNQSISSKIVTQNRTFAKSAKGPRGARGHGWLHHYRNGGGGYHLQGRWYKRDPAKLNKYNDEIFTMNGKKITNCFMEIGIGGGDSDASGGSPVVGRIDFELAYWALPNTCQRFMDFCSADTPSDDNSNVSYLNSKIHKIDKAIGICGGETNTSNQDLLQPQLGSLLEPEGYHISHSSRGILSMCVSTKGMIDSRFLITTGEDNPQLDGRFVAIGRMTNGSEGGDALLTDICKVFNRKGRPSIDITILNCGVY